MSATGNGDGFTIKEILVEVRKDLTSLIDRIDRIDRQGSIGTKQELEDHEQRIRSNEANIAEIRNNATAAQRFNGKAVSWSAVAIAIASGITQAIQRLH